MKKTSCVKIVILLCLMIISLSACHQDLSSKVYQIVNTVEVGEEFNINEMFRYEDKEGISIKIKDPLSIDTSKIGIYDITLIISKNEEEQEKEYTFSVVDTQAPIIDAMNSFVYVGTSFDPESDVYVTVNDNSKGKIQTTVITNNVDISKVGIYSVVYEAVDESGNKSQKEINIIVKDFEEEEQLCEYANNIIAKNNYKNLNCKLGLGDSLVIGDLKFYKSLDTDISANFSVSLNSSTAPIAYTAIQNDLGGTTTPVLTKENFFVRIMVDIEKRNVAIDASNWYTAKAISITSDNGTIESDMLVLPDWERSRNHGTIFEPKYDMTSILGFNVYDLDKFNEVIEGNNISMKLYLYEGTNDEGDELTFETTLSDDNSRLLMEIVDFSKHFIYEYTK